MAGDDETTTTTTKAAGQQQQQKQQWWGTLEELLLVCAVNRHGTKSWDSIAMEVQNRSSTMSSLTPKNCEDKFHDLTRRFGFPSQDDAESGGGGFLVVPALVDQLRRIRVQELRAEVQRRDVSIVSLEMKVKRLEEERERSEKADADLERKTKASAEIIAGKSSAVQADSDERENRSFNESNSMTQKPETTTNKGQNDTIVLDAEEREPTKVKPEPEAETGPVLDEPDPDRDRDWSSNGKLNGTGNVKDDDENDKTTSDGEIKNNKTSGAGGLCESNELWDESKGEGKEAGLRVAAPKQSSDVQSSASLSKTIRRGGVAGCSSSEEVSPATKKVLAVKSEPLIGLLAMIRSHRLGSHFERRLRSQESERYKKLVKQHIDLRTIQSRLDRGLYSKCFQRFYRDLLLLFNNFIIFFKKTSHEHAAAQELRALVVKEMTEKLPKPKLEPEPELELPPVLLPKPSRGSTMVACGRRSSVKALSENASRKEKEKPKVNEKKVGGSSLGVEDKGVKKRRSNERSVSGPRNSRSGGNNNRSNKKGGGGGGGGGGGEVKHQYGNNELSSHDGLDAKLDKKEISMKRRGAASFLRRMKQNSPKKMAEESDEEEDDEDDDDNEDDEDDKDSEEDESKDSRVEEEETKKKRGRNNNNNRKKNKKKKKRDVRRERVTRSSSNSRGRGGGGGGGGEREESGKSGRKMVGRPPKRSGVALAGERKRGRDNGESEVGVVGGGGKSARKRTRR